jgi:hypothetical protein
MSIWSSCHMAIPVEPYMRAHDHLQIKRLEYVLTKVFKSEHA